MKTALLGISVLGLALPGMSGAKSSPSRLRSNIYLHKCSVVVPQFSPTTEEPPNPISGVSGHSYAKLNKAILDLASVAANCGGFQQTFRTAVYRHMISVTVIEFSYGGTSNTSFKSIVFDTRSGKFVDIYHALKSLHCTPPANSKTSKHATDGCRHDFWRVFLAHVRSAVVQEYRRRKQPQCAGSELSSRLKQLEKNKGRDLTWSLDNNGSVTVYFDKYEVGSYGACGHPSPEHLTFSRHFLKQVLRRGR